MSLWTPLFNMGKYGQHYAINLADYYWIISNKYTKEHMILASRLKTVTFKIYTVQFNVNKLQIRVSSFKIFFLTLHAYEWTSDKRWVGHTFAYYFMVWLSVGKMYKHRKLPNLGSDQFTSNYILQTTIKSMPNSVKNNQF